jgi:carboxyl-terminal processing protease
MSSRSRVLIFLVSTPLAAFLVVGGLLGASTVQKGVPHLKVFEDVVALIVNAYVEDVNVDKIFDGAMRGLADGLDSSSGYLTPAEVRTLDANAPPPAGDVGVVLSRQFYLRVIGVRDGSPAKRAGLQTGDFIRAINETPTRDMSAIAGARLLRGAPGSKVSVLVLRGSTSDPHTIDLVREAPTGEAVTSRKLPSGALYLRVASFGSGASEAIRAQLPVGELLSPDLPRNIPPAGAANGVVIDLRATADGTPEEAIAAARLFVKSGTLATRVTRNAANAVTTATPADGPLTMPVVLLVSNGTANAAEIFAAALKGNNRARLVGEPTAGIAGVQRLVRLPEGHGLWLTYAQYAQGDGTPIHGRALRPDVAVEMPTVGFEETPPPGDPALDRAIEELKKPTQT